MVEIKWAIKKGRVAVEWNGMQMLGDCGRNKASRSKVGRLQRGICMFDEALPPVAPYELFTLVAAVASTTNTRTGRQQQVRQGCSSAFSSSLPDGQSATRPIPSSKLRRVHHTTDWILELFGWFLGFLEAVL